MNFGADSPPRGPTPTNDQKSRHSRAQTVPWPGNVYKVFQKGTDTALCLIDDRIQRSSDPNANNLWLLVYQHGFFGFQNQRTGLYMAPAEGRAHCAKPAREDMSLFVPRRHPAGGYELMFFDGKNKLKRLALLMSGHVSNGRCPVETQVEFMHISAVIIYEYLDKPSGSAPTD